MSGRRSLANAMSRQKVRLVSSVEIEKEVYVISFERPFDFQAGQVIGITLNDNIEPRLYSIASGVNDPCVEILFNKKNDGQLTPSLAELKKGDQILITEPFGEFIGDHKPAWWIATGTGVAPFRSMLRSGLSDNKILIHGGRMEGSFFFHHEFDQLEENYIRCSTKEKGLPYFEGRLTRYLLDSVNLSPKIKYYLCGSAEMVVDVRDILINKGIPFKQIMAEIYF